MSNSRCADGLRADPVRSWRLATAVCVALLAGGPVSAQTVPFQSLQRAQFGQGLGQTALPRGGIFVPRLEAALLYAANLDLAPDGDPQVDMAGLEFAPGFYASYSSRAAIGAIDYSFIGRTWEDSDYNDVTQRLNANGEWFAIPEWFSVRGRATYQDAIVDPRFGLDYGGTGIFGLGNLREVATASISPVLRRRFGDFEALAQYSYGRTWYLDEGKGQSQPVVGFVYDQDSTDQAVNLRVGTVDEAGSPLFGSVFYDWQYSTYETAIPYEYERAGLDAGYRLTSTLSAVGTVGSETDLDESSSSGGLDAGFWSAGLLWSPNERTSAEARYGERFFGSSWSLAFTHRARLLEVSASYQEEPTVETRTLSLGDFNPGELPPGLPDVDVSRINSSPFVARNALATVRAVGARNTLSLTGFQRERDYLQATRQDDTHTGVTFAAVRQFASNLSGDFNITYSVYEYEFDDTSVISSSSDYHDTDVTLRLNRRSSARLTLSAEVGYLYRSSDSDIDVVSYNDYDGWWVALRARWTR